MSIPTEEPEGSEMDEAFIGTPSDIDSPQVVEEPKSEEVKKGRRGKAVPKEPEPVEPSEPEKPKRTRRATQKEVETPELKEEPQPKRGKGKPTIVKPETEPEPEVDTNDIKEEEPPQEPEAKPVKVGRAAPKRKMQAEESKTFKAPKAKAPVDMPESTDAETPKRSRRARSPAQAVIDSASSVQSTGSRRLKRRLEETPEPVVPVAATSSRVRKPSAKALPIEVPSTRSKSRTKSPESAKTSQPVRKGRGKTRKDAPEPTPVAPQGNFLLQRWKFGNFFSTFSF